LHPPMKEKRTRASSLLRKRLEQACERDGAVAFGIVSAQRADSLPRIRIRWTINRYTVKLRSVMPGAKSVIVFGIPSTDDCDELEIDRGNGVFSYPGYEPIRVVYRDLVKILTSEGYRANWLREDTSTTSYKRVAALAGIGGFGKNSLILSPRYGPWLRIGLVLTDAPLTPSKPFEEDLCGDCEKCLRACPTGALAPHKVHADKCLVGMTTVENPPQKLVRLLDKYEPKITPGARAMCRVCQVVCPHTPAERLRRSLVR
jgi:epoxyqueuosine reductase